MTKSISSQPIGIFDSGIGGLTVAHAIVKQLPKENIIYFGDTAHLPYGDKSTAAIQAYSIKIAQMLLQQQCKLILIACNSASAAAYELVKEYIADKAQVMNVIDPVINYVKQHYAGKQLALIGTRQTVNSHIYKKKIDALNLNITLASYETNLLAAAIEEFGDHPIIDHLLSVYLPHEKSQSAKDQPIDALILACTHYPIIKARIIPYYKKHVDIIDPSDIVGKALKNKLEQDELLNKEGTGKQLFYISDYTASFETNAKLFFGDNIALEHYPLWD